MLQSDAGAAGLFGGQKSRASSRPRRAEDGSSENVDYIRKELRRLTKMARLMRQHELAHFIDVAAEVAMELGESEAAKAKLAR